MEIRVFTNCFTLTFEPVAGGNVDARNGENDSTKKLHRDDPGFVEMSNDRTVRAGSTNFLRLGRTVAKKLVD